MYFYQLIEEITLSEKANEEITFSGEHISLPASFPL